MRPFLTLTLLAYAAIARADDFDTWLGASPDKHLLAIERRVADPAEPSRLDLDGCTIFICRFEDGMQRDVIAQHNFPGRVVSQIRWSPDSQFLLFTTASSGGHSPWHFNTYAFRAADNTFRDVEDVSSAPVVAPSFQILPPDIAVLAVRDTRASDKGGEMASKQVQIPLAKQSDRMKRIP